MGTFTSADGGKYVGSFRNDNIDGEGTYTSADGVKYTGKFENGEFVAK